jgi:hypothetical protein
MLPDVPLGLMSPDRHEVSHLAAVSVPPGRITDRHAKLGFENLDESVAQLDRDGPADANPTPLVEVRNIEGHAHRTLSVVEAQNNPAMAFNGQISRSIPPRDGRLYPNRFQAA